MFWLIALHLTPRGSGSDLLPLFWGLRRGEKFSAGKLLFTMGLAQMLPLEGKESCLSLPVLFPRWPPPPTQALCWGQDAWSILKYSLATQQELEEVGTLPYLPSLPPFLLSFLLFSFPPSFPYVHSDFSLP
ncbi:hypothetical protein HJG60_011373 [Phyllostomus discolor]|uniref:Uncharacterized protein n=1 Tax=Phyllostomus discolor TaxID=89673 RepID=A0A834A4Q9_9CHIR|nr:hypothetical protein HJG60_011373 [Phyllostomus discolor]